jgi:hypothetical protein
MLKEKFDLKFAKELASFICDEVAQREVGACTRKISFT